MSSTGLLDDESAHRCPISGRKLPKWAAALHARRVSVDQRLIDRLVASTGLAESEAVRVVEDVLAFHHEPVDGYVRRRHAELKTYGVRNEEIFALLREELRGRVVAAPDLSERQLRRIIYT